MITMRFRFTLYNYRLLMRSTNVLMTMKTASGIGLPTPKAVASGWVRHFRLLYNRRMEFDLTWQEASTQLPLPSLCFWADLKTKMAGLPVTGGDIFYPPVKRTTEKNWTKLERKLHLNILYQVCVFRAEQKMATLASD